MAASLIDLAKEYLTPDLISKLSGIVGESPAVTQRAMDMVVPSLAGAAFQKASTPAGASSLLQLLTSANTDGNFLSKLTGLFSSGNTSEITKIGGGLISGLLGNNAGELTSVITRATGVSGSSVSTLLHLGAPLVFGTLAKLLPSGAVSAAALTNLFAAQKDSIVRQTPPEVANLLGIGQTKVPEAPEPLVRPVVEREQGTRLWFWLVPLLAIILALIAWRSCSRRVATQTETLNLPCGTTIQVEQGGFDSSVAKFMMKGSSNDLPKHFTFDHLNFDTNSTQVTPDSNATISNLIATVKCFPAMQVALIGYTDNTGDPAANKKLSLDRANAVKNMLVQGGVNASRISTDGEGQDKPVAPNDTDEGRAKNRRTELTVTKMK
ncbi:MAG: OmpA family protein [Acidobacteriota bacterium]|nr:OmpA family protein [Acidobacteriota bacterium]